MVTQLDMRHHAALVKLWLGFDRLEVDGPALDAQGEQLLCKSIEALELGSIGVVSQAIEDFLHLVIVKAPLAADDARVNLVSFDRARLVKVHVAGHGQTISAGPERAHVVAELLRQHGKHAIDQVDARRTVACTYVDMTVPTHIVRDIGNVHTKAQHAIGLVERDRIVEVLGICRIDGEDVTHAQIVSAVLGKGRLHVNFD